MNRVFRKEIFRSITHSWGRFLAIGIIVALGTGFYAGLRMTGPDMELAADEYYDGTNLYDLRVLSTMGMTDDDVAALQEVEGVKAAMPASVTDVVTIIDNEQYTVRVHSLDAQAAGASDTSDGVDAKSDDEGYINRPLLVSGSWPDAPGECVLAADRVMNTPVHIGDTVQVVEGAGNIDEILKHRSLTITGFVRSSYYTSPTSLGTTGIGSGFLQQYMYVAEDEFADDYPYTEIFLTVEGAEQDTWGSDAYQEKIDAVTKSVQEIAPSREHQRYLGLKAEAQSSLDEKRAEYEQQKGDAESQLAAAKARLDSAASTISGSEAKLASGQQEYDAGVAALAQQKSQAEVQFAAAYEDLSAQQLALDAAWVDWQYRWDHRNPGDPVQEAMLLAEKDMLDGMTAQLNGAWAAYYAQKGQAEAGFAEAQTKLDQAAATLSNGRAQLATGRAEYSSGLAAYGSSKAEADTRLADAAQQLEDAQRQIDSMEEPTWYVMDRTKNSGANSFKSDAGRVDQIARVFPFLFFLVAALVALTTMTRMVEEERTLIGTYKALGYGRATITSKYLIYAALASVVGSMLGIGILSQVLPKTIFNAYTIMYAVPVGPTPIDPYLASLSALLGVGVTLVATWGAAAATLREKPAALMLPKAPKPGKRIVLERIGFIWKRLNFSWKVTFRNIFRYKRRFVMTIIGIAGCTALLLTGFGLSDAITDIISKQYGEITRYNTTIALANDISEEDQERVDEVINDKSLVSSYGYTAAEAMVASDGKTEKNTYVIVPEDPRGFPDFVTMRNRVSGEDLAMNDTSAIISEKLSNQLGLMVGDSLSLSEQDQMGNATGSTFTVEVGGIMENYIGGSIYMTPAYYEKTTGKGLDYSIIVALSPNDADIRTAISDRLLAVDGVRTVGYNDESISSYQKMLSSVNSIVVVLIVAAAVLAFVVLYNLTNINITERQREIATLKVLGFLPREVNAYIFRETILLTILGALVGLVLGVFMENYVVVTAEVDQVMFGRSIHPLSFAISFAMTLVFSWFVSVVMRRKLARIDMVESLKSIE